MQQGKAEPVSHIIYKVGSKWAKDPATTGKSAKFLEGNTGGDLLDTGLCNGFLDMHQKA